ncbi:MAG: hypothetical protein MRZ39_06985 [Oscillospiraceae bacterium]|nr:hypothetical protein [Oscillospiraceae bacterium]
MLTHDEKYVLKKIIKLTKIKPRINSNKELLNEVSKKYTVSELDRILDSLHEKKFFDDEEKYTKYQNGGRVFTVKHETQRYNEVTLKKTITFLFSSVVVPAIVSVITAWLTVGR